MNCTDCKENILSGTPSSIGSPKCNGDCPEAITCVDIIPSNCVFYSGQSLSCDESDSTIPFGVTVTTAIGTLFQMVCAVSNSQTVQVTANDTCYGYLASKITSSSLDISVSSPGACEKLNIEEKCWSWNNVRTSNGNIPTIDGTFFKKWKNSIFQIAQYSNVKECSVKLRGTVQNNSYSNTDKIIFTLPTGFRPLATRRFSVNISNGVSSVPTAIGFIYIYSDGTVVLEYTQPITGTTVVSLDGIEFETT